METENVIKNLEEMGKDIVISKRINPIITIGDITLNLGKIVFITEITDASGSYTVYFEGGFTKTFNTSRGNGQRVDRSQLIKLWELYYNQKTPN